MDTVRTSVFGKLNLTLDILGAEGGYHLIDSLVLTVGIFDRIVVRKRKDGLIRVSMHGMGSEAIPPEENNALRAGERFRERFSTAGADITVYKNIPMGAGLGGSSADAAGVLNALARLYGAEEGALKEIADSIGSDVAFLRTGGFARMTGRGEKIEPLGDPPELFFLLLVPGRGVKTAECYRRSDGYVRGAPHTARALEALAAGGPEWGSKLFSNDLFEAAKEIEPEIAAAARELRALSPWCVNMTGSGSGVYAVFETEELCRWAESRYRGKCRTYVLKPAKYKNGVKNPFVLGDEEGR